MRVVVHLSRWYDWEPLPPEVKVTPDEPESDFAKAVAAGLVKPSFGGKWTMRVERDGPTHRLIVPPESQLTAEMIDSRVGPRKQIISRREAVGHCVARCLDGHAREEWITGFEVEDLRAPEEIHGVAHAHLWRFVEAGKLDADHKDRCHAVYTTPATSVDIVGHLHARFNVPRKAGS